MNSIEQQTANQIANIERTTGRSLPEWIALIRASGVDRHAQIIAWLKTEHGLTHGNANLLAIKARDAASGRPTGEGLVEAHYSGKNAELRSIYELVVAKAHSFGPDIELSPKKTYVSLRRKKQFATVGPAAGRLEVCVNLPGRPPTARLEPTSGMATHKVRIENAAAVDEELIGWMHEAYDAAG
jgi:hypothetical protein